MLLLKKTSMKEQVYQIIKSRILTQKYALGERINIYNLAEELHISNTPIREALGMLEKDGLVVICPNAGYKVIRFTDKSARALTETVTALLIGGYRVCISKNMGPALVKMMSERLRTQQALMKDSSEYDYVKATVAFDEVFLAVLENDTLYTLFQSISDRMFLLILHEHTHFEVDRTNNMSEHVMLFDAVKAGNQPLVEELLVSHFAKPLEFEEEPAL